MSNQLRLLIFIVVISGALCTVEDYVIMSQCAHNRAIHIAADGTVSVTDISQTQNITIVGLPDYLNNDFKIALHAKETQRYLCFNEHWKLVGMKELQDTCYFNETIIHGYFVFRSVVDLQRRVGFTHRGKAIGPKKNVNDACYLFTKIPADLYFHQHNEYFAPKTKSTASTTTIAASTATITTTSSSPTASATQSKTSKNNKSKASHRNKNNRNNGMRNNTNRNNNNNNNNNNSNSNNNNNNNINNNNNSNKNRTISYGHSSNISSGSITQQQQHEKQYQNKIKLSNQNNNNTNSGREHMQQHHQVRHHHNDPNVIARRQHHEQKQKRRQRNRLRATAASHTKATTAISSIKPMSSSTTKTPTEELTPTVMRHSTPFLPTTILLLSTARPSHQHLNTQTFASPTLQRTTTTTTATPSLATQRLGQSFAMVTIPTAVAGNSSHPKRRRKGGRSHKKRLHQHRLSGKKQEDKQKLEALLSASNDLSISRTTTVLTTTPSTPSASSISLDNYVYPTRRETSIWTPVYTASSPSDYNDTSTTVETYSSPSSPVTFDTFSTLDTISSFVANEFNISSDLLADIDNYNETSLESVNATDLLLLTDLNNSTGEDDAHWTSPVLDNEDLESTNTDQYTDQWESWLSPTAVMNQTDTDELFSEGYFNSSSLEQDPDESKNEFTTIVSTDPTQALVNVNDNSLQELYNSKQAPTPTGSIASSTFATTWYDKWKSIGQQRNGLATTNREVTTTREGTTTSSSIDVLDRSSTEFIFTNRSSNVHHKNSRHRYRNGSNGSTQQNFLTNTGVMHKKQNNNRHQKHNRSSIDKPPITTTKSLPTVTTILQHLRSISNNRTIITPTTAIATDIDQESKPNHDLITDLGITYKKNINNNNTENTLSESSFVNINIPSFAVTPTAATHSRTSPTLATAVTRKHLRKSTQILQATPFHQLTYVRNSAGEIDFDNIDNISIYPEDDLGNIDPIEEEPEFRSRHRNNSRLTVVSAYLPTSATINLPESIRIAKIKINKERKRMLRQRHIGSRMT